MVSIAFAQSRPALPVGREEQVRELQKLRGRLVMSYTGAMLPDNVFKERARRAHKAAEKILANKDGWWSAYTRVEQPEIMLNGGAWRPAATLAVAWATPQDTFNHSPQVLEAIAKGLTHLAQFAYPDCPKPGNWWAWEIGNPMSLLRTLTLCGDALDPALRTKLLDTLTYLLKAREDVKLAGAATLPLQDLPGETDMNALWHARLCLELAILLKNPAMAGKWAQTAMSEIGEPGHGHLQADFSYKFHKGIPMWAYGRNFLYDYAFLIDTFRDSAFGPSAAQKDRLYAMATHFVNGFLYRGALCPAMTGRELSRNGSLYEEYGLSGLKALSALVRAGHPHSRELASLIMREQAYYLEPRLRQQAADYAAGVPRATLAPPVNDIFAYPDSDFLQVTRPDWALGIKMHSSRNRGYESINGENLQGWFFSHGSMFLLLSGREWENCWPTLDWMRLPGTSVAADVKSPSTSPYAGVLRISAQRAVAAMELVCGGFHARKSWFVNGNAIICVGSDIRGPGRVETTVINQPAPAGAALAVDGEGMPDEAFEKELRCSTLWFQRVAYIFPEPQLVHIQREKRRSDWSSIRDPKRYGAGETVESWYVTVVIPHTDKQRGYRYVMFPNVIPSVMPELKRSVETTLQISADRPHRMSLKDGSAEGFVFWAAQKDGAVTADGPCMMFKDAKTCRVVDPTWSDRPLHLTVGGKTRELPLHHGRPAEFGL